MKKKITAVLALLGLFASSAMAQEATPSAFANMDSSQLTLLIIMGVVLGVIVLLLILMIYLMSFMATVLKKDDPVLADEPSWWESFKERFVTGQVDEVGGREEKAKLMADHSYDGIHELDNFMPPWLQYVFIGTIIFAVGYFVNYSVLGIGKTGVEEYEEELRLEAIAAEERQATMLASIDETTVVFDESSAALSGGKSIFEGNCAACHATDGGGGVGPNLTDEYWIHGGSISDIFSVVKYGVVEKGMVPWEDQLSPEEIQQVSSYILTMQGTSPANPKEPQGEIYAEPSSEESESASSADSTAVATPVE
ncbi:cbb3-type cytochrome c oxidase N-terminal domain-containing protein [Algoriphagus namhaensis]